MKTPLALTSACCAFLLSGCSSSRSLQTASETDFQPSSIQPNASDLSVSPYVSWDPPPFETIDGTLPLSIEAAVFTALGRNRELRIQSLEPVIAGAFEQIERSRFNPELFGSAQASEEEVSETARSTGEQFSVTGRDAQGEIGIRQELATGADIELAIGQNRSISNRTPEQQEARVGLSVTQSLLRGFGPAVNLASVRQAKIDTLASQYQLRGYTEEFVADVEIAYWNYVLAQQEMSIFESSLTLAQQERDEVEGRIEVGALSETEGAIARGELARRKSALIDTRAELERQKLRLARLLNIDPSEVRDLSIETTSAPATEPDPLDDIESRAELALLKRSDLNESRLRLQQERLQTVVTRNGLLPQLDLFITLGKSGYADAFLDSFEDLQEDSYDVSAGLRFSQFLGETASQARDLAARANREQAAEAVLNHEQIVRLDVQLAVTEVERAREQIEATADIRRHLEETVIGEEERLEVGDSTELQVAEARRDLLESRIREVEALINYRIALVELYLSEGSLLERRGISIP
ncbi:TolC family protein [Pelagicoccus sp. SDUM812003]|uniref:TolC family protein n=1 Tax=Pelagicoccus sp. SDUM812003 TaxID=3041267 RepID=UPI00280F83B9|nr:TolC family protein [Pelagicoccus sp. SDUM812003]MDQ8202335.1 TolC family protein [Pelagicoccus sp. SDUM812003]